MREMIKRFLAILTSAAVAAAIFVGCSCSEESKVNNSSSTPIDATETTKAYPNITADSAVAGRYVNANYHYSLTIPDDAVDKIAIKGNDSIVYIYDKSILESYDDHHGVLAYIFVDSIEAEIPYTEYKVLGSDDKCNYILSIAEEKRQYDADDKEAKASYQECKGYLDAIAESFTLNNQ